MAKPGKVWRLFHLDRIIHKHINYQRWRRTEYSFFAKSKWYYPITWKTGNRDNEEIHVLETWEDLHEYRRIQAKKKADTRISCSCIYCRRNNRSVYNMGSRAEYNNWLIIKEECDELNIRSPGYRFKKSGF